MKSKLCDPPNCNEPAYACRGCGAQGCYYKMRKDCRCQDGPDEESLEEQDECDPREGVDLNASQECVRRLPIGTKIISLANEWKIGTIMSESYTRGIPEYTVKWDDGGDSIFFSNQDIKNKIKQYKMTDSEIVVLYSNLPHRTRSDWNLIAYERPCDNAENKIGKCVLVFGWPEYGNNCIYCGSRITPMSDI